MNKSIFTITNPHHKTSEGYLDTLEFDKTIKLKRIPFKKKKIQMNISIKAKELTILSIAHRKEAYKLQF